MMKTFLSPDNATKEAMQNIARNIILVISLSVFLPYTVTSVVMLCVGAAFCVLPGVRDKIFAHKGVFLAFFFLALTSVVALCYGNYLGFERTCVFAGMLVIACVARSLATRRFFEKLMNMLVIGGCLATAHSIIEAVLNRDDPLYRCQGFFTNPNFFGTALTFVIIICAYKASTHAKRVLLYYAAAVFNAVGLYLCGSMSLWLVAFIAVTLMLILHREYRLLIIFLSAVGAAVLALLFIPGLIPRLGELSATTDNRVKIWSFALEQIKEAPVFGRGFYSYKFLYNQLHTVQDIYPASLSHNVILDSVLCHGIVGTLLVSAAFLRYFVSLFSCRRLRKKQGKKSPISSLVIALAVALLCYGMMDTTFVWVQTGTIVLLIGSGLGVEENELRELR